MAKTIIRTALERRHRKLISPLEARFASDYRKVMRDLRESIRSSGKTPFNLAKWQDKAVAAMRPAYRAAILAGGRDFITNTISVRSKIARLKAAKKRSVDVVLSLEDQFESRLRETITTTYEGLADILAEAVADKLDPDEVGDLIDEEWDDILGRRTDAIALTETNGAVNSVRDYLMLELVELQSWVNARDERVRPTHVIYGDAGPKPVGFDWSQLVPDAGYTLRYPCDPECHEPAEVVNCRCFTVPEGEVELSTADLKDYLADFEMDPEDLIRSEDQEPVYVTNAYTGKGFEDQPRDEGGRWTAGSGSIAAGSGAAREGRDRRVDGDGAHLTAEGGPGTRVPEGSTMVEPMVYSVPGGGTLYRPGAALPKWLTEPKEPPNPHETDDEGRLRRRRNEVRDEFARVQNERIQSIKWVQPARARGEEMVEVDVAKLDESWKGEPSYRIDEKGSNAIGNRLSSFGEWLHNNPTTAVETPEVGLNQNGKISFTNGRHRFAYLRDRGVRTIFVSVPKSEARKVRAIAGVEPQKKGVLKGDYEGHPFRGNQWTQGTAHGSEAADKAMNNLSDTQDFADKLLFAYAKDHGYFESDAFSGGSGDDYDEFNDYSARLGQLIDRQDEDMKRLGIEFKEGDPRRNAWGSTHPNGPLEVEDSRSNMIASLRLVDEVIAAVEGAPPEVRELLKTLPLKIEYTAEAPKVVINGETFTQGAAVGYTTINGEPTDLTLYMNRATSTSPNAIPHEIGHVYTAALHALNGSSDRRNDVARVLMQAYKAEGGITDYADSFKDSTRTTTSGFGVGPNESFAEMEAAFNSLRRLEGRGDPWSFAMRMATGRMPVRAIIPGLIPKPFPKTALAWLTARGSLGESPAPKNLSKWTTEDFKTSWKHDRLYALANGKPDPGPWDDDTSEKLIRERWSFLSKGVTKGDFEGHPFRGNQYTDGVGGIKADDIERAYEGERIRGWFESGEVGDRLGPLADPENRAWANENPEEFGKMIARKMSEKGDASWGDWTDRGFSEMDSFARSILDGKMPSSESPGWVGSMKEAAFRFERVYGMLDQMADPDRATDRTLWRGMVVSSDRLPGVGGTFADPMMSFSTSERVAQGFATGNAGGTNVRPREGQESVILRTEGTTRGVLGGSRDQSGDNPLDEAEAIVGGKFEVTKIETREDGVKVYTVRQVEQNARPKRPWELEGKPPKALRERWDTTAQRRASEKRQAMIAALHEAEDSGRKLTAEEEAFRREYLSGLGL